MIDLVAEKKASLPLISKGGLSFQEAYPLGVSTIPNISYIMLLTILYTFVQSVHSTYSSFQN